MKNIIYLTLATAIFCGSSLDSEAVGVNRSKLAAMQAKKDAAVKAEEESAMPTYARVSSQLASALQPNYPLFSQIIKGLQPNLQARLFDDLTKIRVRAATAIMTYNLNENQLDAAIDFTEKLCRAIGAAYIQHAQLPMKAIVSGNQTDKQTPCDLLSWAETKQLFKVGYLNDTDKLNEVLDKIANATQDQCKKVNIENSFRLIRTILEFARNDRRRHGLAVWDGNTGGDCCIAAKTNYTGDRRGLTDDIIHAVAAILERCAAI